MRHFLLQICHLIDWYKYRSLHAQSPSRFTFLIAGFCRALPSWDLVSGPKYLRLASVNQYLCHALLQPINMDMDAMSWKQDVLFNQVFGLFYWTPPPYKTSLFTKLLYSSRFIPANKNCSHKNTCTCFLPHGFRLCPPYWTALDPRLTSALCVILGKSLSLLVSPICAIGVVKVHKLVFHGPADIFSVAGMIKEVSGSDCL